MEQRRRPEPGILPGVGLQRKTQHVEPPGGGGVGLGPGTLPRLGLQRATQKIRQAEPVGGVVPTETGTGVST